ncbi:MAG: ATPase, partial [Undibacterium sp.]|nr:ATPase [Opitutaceae bacterium]
MSPNFKIGIDGGGTKTECILLDAAGTIVARHLAPGCNPNIIGPEAARTTVTAALTALTSSLNPQPSTLNSSSVATTLLFMSGAPTFWEEFAASLTGYGRVTAAPDSLPALELATRGAPGLVLHAGTGSFVAARAPDGTLHYAGGTGWRFGDPGSGYELGRRAISRALLELQGWLPPSRLGPAVRDHTQLGAAADARAITRYFYAHAEPNRLIAALAPAVLRLAT